MGVGLLLMRGLSTSSHWTHLLPGLIVAGAGSGLVNTPLAAVAVGVVNPRRAGMASGINSTFRQVGIAAGVAALGSIFATLMRNGVTTSLAHTPLARQAHQLAQAVSSGHVAQAIAHAPRAYRGQVAAAASGSFVHALNDLVLIAAVVAFLGAAASLALIRRKDMITATEPGAEAARWSAAAPVEMQHAV